MVLVSVSRTVVPALGPILCCCCSCAFDVADACAIDAVVDEAVAAMRGEVDISKSGDCALTEPVDDWYDGTRISLWWRCGFSFGA